jgi:hypothetical protein
MNLIYVFYFVVENGVREGFLGTKSSHINEHGIQETKGSKM